MTGRIVLDASAAIAVALRLESSARLQDILASASLVVAPSLICSEIANTLRKYRRQDQISTEDGIRLYEWATNLVDEFIADEDLALEAFSTSVQAVHPVYDMLYLIAARRFGCALLSCDQRLIALARSLHLPVAG